jgi:hypothetical protein
LWWAVGDNGLIATAISQDSVKVITDITDLPLNKIFFYDTDNGWITGGYAYEGDNQPLLLKTTDGGINWAKVPDFRSVANDIYFRDALQGWAVGYDSTGQGIILESNDGGDSWQIQMNHLPGPLNALHFVKDYGWAVGAMGLVLSTADGGSNWIEHTREEKFPLKFNLSQNYPNPFNPITIINYELLILNDVELSVYNLLGQKVAILVSKKQAAGYHQVEWDASSFSSGIYYYRLEVGKFRDVKKMVLLR